MRCNDCTHYDVCYQYDIIGEDDNEMCALYEQKRPHGEWIYHKEWEIDGECPFECSKCGMGSDVDYKFCPNCGSDNRPRILDESVDGEGKDGNVKEGDEK